MMITFVDNGFYTVGGKVFINKIQAILESEKTHKPVEFNFHDDSYSRVDWTKEPDSTLEELYAARAWELRNTYDYLVLHFSGGSDSLNILETFIKNKIPLDELFIRGSFSDADKNKNNVSASNLYAEIPLQAVPLAEWAKNTHYPNLVITVVDTIDYTLDYFKNPKWFETYTNSTFPCGVVWRSDWDHLVPRYGVLADKGKKIGHILGAEKPILYTKNDQYYVGFLDKYRENLLGTRLTNLDLPYYIEAFYWADSTGLLICKQAHTIKNTIKKSNTSLEQMKIAHNRRFHDWIGSVIYNRTLPIYFQANKPDFMKHEQDGFFFKDQHSEYLKNYKIGIDYFDKILPDHRKHQKHQDAELFDLLGVWSKSYCIGN